MNEVMAVAGYAMNGSLNGSGNRMSELLKDAQPVGWIKDMYDFQAKNGYFRASDLLRLLGDPCERVEVSEEGLRKALSKKR